MKTTQQLITGLAALTLALSANTAFADNNGLKLEEPNSQYILKFEPREPNLNFSKPLFIKPKLDYKMAEPEIRFYQNNINLYKTEHIAEPIRNCIPLSKYSPCNDKK